MSKEEELADRLKRYSQYLYGVQIRWLRAFRGIRIATLMLGVAIPVIALALRAQLTTAILGACIAVLTGINEIFQPEQAVITLSRARGIITRNLTQYEDKVEPYKSGDVVQLLNKAYLDSHALVKEGYIGRITTSAAADITSPITPPNS